MVELAVQLEFLHMCNPEVAGGCWEWRGCCTSAGYGYWSRGGESFAAHRLSYELFKGPIGTGLCVCHECDNPTCVNPEHLWLGTHRANSLDMYAKGRNNQARGGAAGNAKLTEGQVRSIRAMKLSATETAALFGVSTNTVYQIRQYKSWIHV